MATRFPHFFLWFVLLTTVPFRAFCAEKAKLDINSDLIEILDSFDDKKKQNHNSIPKLSDIMEAKGTLVFFDNTGSTGKMPELGSGIVKKTPFRNATKKTLENARERLFGSQAETKEDQREAVFSSRNREKFDVFDMPVIQEQQKPQLFKIDYDGPKTVVTIPPASIIEVPFYKHLPYFFSRIEILANGSILVTERIIRVVEEKEKNFTGMDRYFPRFHIDRTGEKHRTDILPTRFTIDGQPATPVIRPSALGIKVLMHSDKPLKAGSHLFEISYIFSNVVSRFKDESSKNADGSYGFFKELIWDVTGRHWKIPITRAAAVVIFPTGSKVYSQAAITGSPGAYAQEYKIKKDAENNLSYTISFPLGPYENFVILANWAEKDPVSVLQNGTLDTLVKEYGFSMVLLTAFAFILSYYLISLSSLKKGQKTGSKKPAPLQRGLLTPWVLHYALHDRKADIKSLYILLLNMADKGFISFTEESDGTLSIVKETDKDKGLSPIERKIAKLMFVKESTSFPLKHANALRLTRMLTEMEKTLKKEYKNGFTTFQHKHFLFGLMMAFIAVVTVASLSLTPAISFATATGCAIFFFPTAIFAVNTYDFLRQNPFKQNKSVVFLKVMFILPFAFAAYMSFVFFSFQTSVIAAYLYFAVLGCIVVFFFLLRSTSSMGQSVFDNIDGYKLYLSSQDETLLSVMRNAVNKIKALYGKHLPFAVALDVDEPWTKRFFNFSEKENQLKPDWYKGKLIFDESFTQKLFDVFSSVAPKTKTEQTPAVRNSRFKKKI